MTARTTPSMHAPARASHKKSCSGEGAPGICQSLAHGDLGWFVPVRSRKRAHHALIRLWVRDPHSTFAGFVRFVIDTGSEVTVIPRREVVGLHAAAFSSRFSSGSATVLTVAGVPSVGESFSASLSLMPAGGGPAHESYEFGDVTIVVADEWPPEWPGILGLDVLRQLILVADAKYFTLWRHLETSSRS